MESLDDHIEKYLKGELTASERHALEQRALKDPFLAEALEGAETNAAHFSLDLELLQRSIKEKTAVRGERRRISLNGWHLYMGIAAGLLILAVSSFIVLMMMRQQQENKDLAQITTTTKDSAVTNASPTTAPAIASEVDSSLSENKPEESGPIASSSRPVQRVVQEQPTSRNEVEVEAALQEPPVIAKRNDRGFISSDSTALSATTATGEGARHSEAPIEKLVKGKIISAEDGSELAGVNVLIKGTNKGTISDPKGEFEIGIPEGSDALVFSFIGLKSNEVSLMNNTPLVVKMSSDNSQLTEMVVTGEDAGWDLEFPFMEMAAPEGGRNAFKKYLTEKMQYPHQALTNKVEGGVTVQFTVLPSGQLVDFKILNGLGYGCDEEVIRLIKEGPSWAPSRLDDQPVKEDVRIRLIFDLPERK
jgi:TonB family protein